MGKRYTSLALLIAGCFCCTAAAQAAQKSDFRGARIGDTLSQLPPELNCGKIPFTNVQCKIADGGLDLWLDEKQNIEEINFSRSPSSPGPMSYEDFRKSMMDAYGLSGSGAACGMWECWRLENGNQISVEFDQGLNSYRL